jgi:hypothetical protein
VVVEEAEAVPVEAVVVKVVVASVVVDVDVKTLKRINDLITMSVLHSSFRQK